jgi:hypothetical protein
MSSASSLLLPWCYFIIGAPSSAGRDPLPVASLEEGAGGWCQGVPLALEGPSGEGGVVRGEREEIAPDGRGWTRQENVGDGAPVPPQVEIPAAESRPPTSEG